MLIALPENMFLHIHSRHNTFPTPSQTGVVSDSDDFTFLPSLHGTQIPLANSRSKTHSPLVSRRPLSAANPNIDSYSGNPVKQIKVVYVIILRIIFYCKYLMRKAAVRYEIMFIAMQDASNIFLSLFLEISLKCCASV